LSATRVSCGYPVTTRPIWNGYVPRPATTNYATIFVFYNL